ncbi:hypothetical protein EVAR_23274_1 [Eumeta japonica]|uniref:Uncharacterized protein n=1 Tax=Eumeta variegata TaxID=151549 RepID=A0A4C1V6P4_EUMVA|nr:hypothetical protein EVAR_23274_1 [Eumeta japonica]
MTFAQQRNAGEKNEGQSVTPTHCIMRRLLRAAEFRALYCTVRPHGGVYYPTVEIYPFFGSVPGYHRPNDVGTSSTYAHSFAVLTANAHCGKELLFLSCTALAIKKATRGNTTNHLESVDEWRTSSSPPL